MVQPVIQDQTTLSQQEKHEKGKTHFPKKKIQRFFLKPWYQGL